MSNPSTVWAQLSLPLSPVGSVPFVTIDGQTIVTDVANFQYLPGDYASFVGSQLPYQLTIGNGLRVPYTDLTAIPSTTYTINKVSGRITIPLGQSAVTVTSACCFESSMVLTQMLTVDPSVKSLAVETEAGAFTVFADTSVSNNLVFDFLIINRF